MSEWPVPNRSGRMTTGDLERLRVFMNSSEVVNVGDFDRVRMFQWMRQLLRFVEVKG